MKRLPQGLLLAALGIVSAGLLHAHPAWRAELLGFLEGAGLPGYWLFSVVYNVALVPFPYDVFVLAWRPLMPEGSAGLLWAAACSATVAAGALDYALGHRLAPWVRGWLGRQKGYARAVRALQDYGVLAVGLSAVTPVPYSLVCWLAGLAGVRFSLFLPVAAASRGLRFALVLWVFGV